jgi:uncharacterized protein (TIGR02147 family)
MSIYNYINYRTFILDCFKDKSFKRRKTELASYLGCGPAFVSQALSEGKTHFSSEHIYKVAQFLELENDEFEFLFVLHQYEKAGSEELKNYFLKKIKSLQKDKKEIDSKIKKSDRKLLDIEKSTYYSHWSYMAIHMAASLPRLKTTKLIANYLRLEIDFVEKIVNFLLETGLVAKENNRLTIGKTRIHLDRHSPLIKSLHQNMRQKAIESLISTNDFNLNYSSILVLSKDDSMKIRNMILDLIKKKEEILIPSPEEDMVVFNIDYFQL